MKNTNSFLLLMVGPVLIASSAAAGTMADVRSRMQAVVAGGTQDFAPTTIGFPSQGGVDEPSSSPAEPPAKTSGCKKKDFPDPSRSAEACADYAVWRAKNEAQVRVPDALAEHLDEEIPALRAAFGDLDALHCRDLSPDYLAAAVDCLLATGPSDVADCSETPAPVPPPTPARTSIFRDPNFLKCLSIYSNSLASSDAADECLQQARSFSFVDNANFDACYAIYSESLPKSDAAGECIHRSRSFSFVDNANFDACYAIYSKSLPKSDAAGECIARLE